ncbi:MAG: flagellar brake protein [Syntrophobacterales bacterium]|nr:flagellar brake protein [Syntrophobacterales bacterium]
MKKLPLEIGQELFIRPLGENMPHKAKTQIVGARHGEFIIIDEPAIKISNRLIIPVGEAVLCWFLHEGNVYRFESIIRKSLEERLCILEYPLDFQVESLRRHIRIQVNLETEFKIGFREQIFRGTISDISESGCKLVVDSITIVSRNQRIVLSFMLPDNRIVRDIEGIVRNVLYDRLRMKTEMGIQFKGPESELSKISSFCQFCQYFKV